MGSDIDETASGRTKQPQDLPAGDFSSWLRHTRDALLDNRATDVACGDCVGCCSSFYFIPVKSDETAALSRIPERVLVAVPGLPTDHVLMGYDKDGLCPMLVNGKCSIYENRPQTCRSYDCRVFTAAGIAAGDDGKTIINQRIKRWQFSYPSVRDRDEHLAVQAAATFIREHAHCFPGRRVPSDSSQLAILAIKAYDVFLEKDGNITERGTASDNDIADAIVEACRVFETTKPGH